MFAIGISAVRVELMLVDRGVRGDKDEVAVFVGVDSVTTGGGCILCFEVRLTSETVAVLRFVTAAELVLKDFR